MGKVGVNICDWCGKRQNVFCGKLVLFKTGKTKDRYSYQITERSWQLCKNCFDKMGAIKSVGDEIKKEIELKIDKLHLENKDFKYLE